mgnify:CR=1 FL=1
MASVVNIGYSSIIGNGYAAVLLKRRIVLGVVTFGQNAAVNCRMERTNTPAEHFRVAGEIGHFDARNAEFPESLGGAASRDDLPLAAVGQRFELFETGFVGHRNYDSAFLVHG